MDTVSWLSFFTASGLGAALGVLSLTALGACLYLRAPGQRRLAILAAALGCVLVLQYGGGALLEERWLFWRGGVQTALSLTGGQRCASWAVRQPCWGRPPAPERGLWEAAGENRWSAWRERPWWSGMRICSTRWDGVM